MNDYKHYIAKVYDIYKVVIRRKLIATLVFIFKKHATIKIEKKKTINVKSNSRHNL